MPVLEDDHVGDEECALLGRPRADHEQQRPARYEDRRQVVAPLHRVLVSVEIGVGGGRGVLLGFSRQVRRDDVADVLARFLAGHHHIQTGFGEIGVQSCCVEEGLKVNGGLHADEDADLEASDAVGFAETDCFVGRTTRRQEASGRVTAEVAIIGQTDLVVAGGLERCCRDAPARVTPEIRSPQT